MTAPELKPCPFCGADAQITETNLGFQIGCMGGTCYLDGGGASRYGKRVNAINDWNRRAEAPVLSGTALSIAWARYVELFWEAPHGTEKQLAALLELVRHDEA